LRTFWAGAIQVLAFAIGPTGHAQYSTVMSERSLFASLLLSVLCFSGQTRAQFTDAHTYDNTPMGINQIELSYAYLHANASIDNSLVIAGAKLNLYQGTFSYTRYFGLANRLMWVNAGVPVAGLSGEVTERPSEGLLPAPEIPAINWGRCSEVDLHSAFRSSRTTSLPPSWVSASL
jgi:hypothetical protein